ncbi:MAG: hypothetical protein GWN31_00380 [Candidatus Thorarchaeota archaeon]|nr:hypothetical protein [Candidatus Thorarchaeota archaeon]
MFLGFLTFMYVVAILHEFSHAGTYYHYSGEVGEVGITFNFFIPFLYTKTPQTRSMGRSEAVMVFLAGSMVNMFFTALCTYLYLLGGWPAFWGLCAYGAGISSLMTFLPFVKGDGYYILQRVAQFPNLMHHSIEHLKMVGKLLLRRISLTEYKKYLSMYSQRERKYLLVYTLLLPVGIPLLVYIFVIQLLIFGVLNIVALTPKILFGTVQTPQLYFLWVFYLFGISLTLLGIIGRILQKLREKDLTFLDTVEEEKEVHQRE